jgi:hypothetical protein
MSITNKLLKKKAKPAEGEQAVVPVAAVSKPKLPPPALEGEATTREVSLGESKALAAMSLQVADAGPAEEHVSLDELATAQMTLKRGAKPAEPEKAAEEAPLFPAAAPKVVLPVEPEPETVARPATKAPESVKPPESAEPAKKPAESGAEDPKAALLKRVKAEVEKITTPLQTQLSELKAALEALVEGLEGEKLKDKALALKGKVDATATGVATLNTQLLGADASATLDAFDNEGLVPKLVDFVTQKGDTLDALAGENGEMVPIIRGDHMRVTADLLVAVLVQTPFMRKDLEDAIIARDPADAKSVLESIFSDVDYVVNCLARRMGSSITEIKDPKMQDVEKVAEARKYAQDNYEETMKRARWSLAKLDWEDLSQRAAAARAGSGGDE